jgi:hypothetical protein
MPETTTKAPVPEYTYDVYLTAKCRYAKRKEVLTKTRKQTTVEWK